MWTHQMCEGWSSCLLLIMIHCSPISIVVKFQINMYTNCGFLAYTSVKERYTRSGTSDEIFLMEMAFIL